MDKKITEKNTIKNNKRKVILFRITVGAVIALLALFALYSALKFVSPDENEKEEQTVERHFYKPEPGEDIRNDKEYLDKQRDITYYDGYGNGYYITDGDYIKRGGLPLEVMHYFFDAVINGNSAKLNALFSEEYLKSKGEFKDFGPQGVYDITVALENEEIDKKTGNTTTVYTVSYKIMKNDGSFRRDIGSDSSRKQYFSILETATDIFITEIVDVKLIF